jgi:ArsR family transcriptional regulator
LEREELTVAELAEATRLAQPRVSTHLARLREAELVSDRRDGVSVYYRIAAVEDQPELHRLWQLFRTEMNDALISEDGERLPDVLLKRASGRNWADAVAGDMERRYSPGRSWEATARAMVQLLSPCRVLDIASGDGVMGELLASRAESIDCIDLSEKVVTAGRQRVGGLDHVHFHHGDMHDLPFEDQSFDTALMLHALTYSDNPETAFREAARVLKPKGRLLCATLHRHRYAEQVRAYGHVNSGFRPEQLRTFAVQAGLRVRFCDITSIERRSPHFKIITLLAEKS